LGDFEPKPVRCCLSLTHVQHVAGIADIGHERQPTQIRDNLAQEFNPFARNLGRLERQAGNVAAWSGQTGDAAAPNRIAPGRGRPLASKLIVRPFRGGREYWAPAFR
jgi:hypothetical protein